MEAFNASPHFEAKDQEHRRHRLGQTNEISHTYGADHTIDYEIDYRNSHAAAQQSQSQSCHDIIVVEKERKEDEMMEGQTQEVRDKCYCGDGTDAVYL